MKHKDLPVSVKAGPDAGLDEGQFTAYASVFGNIDSYGDIVQKGAFADTLADWDAKGLPIPVYWGHDMADPYSNIGGVTSAEEDERGLKVTAQLDLDNPKSAQVYRLLKGGRVAQMSFAYDVIEGGLQKSADDGEFYSIDKAKLYEVSVVPIGANQETEILAVKANTDALVAGIKAGRVLSAKNEGLVRDAHQALTSVLSVLDADDDQEKASGTTEAKSDASDEEPAIRAKSSAPDEEQASSPSARVLAAHTHLTLTNRS